MTDEVGRQPTFSQRAGQRPYPTALQMTEMDERFRVDILNHLERAYLTRDDQTGPFSMYNIWVDHLGGIASEFAEYKVTSKLRQTVLAGEWFEVYDLIEWFHQACNRRDARLIAKPWNEIFALNRGGYRVIDAYVVPIATDAEISSIEQAIGNALTPAQKHLRTAVALFAQRSNAQYAKVVGEAITAAEAAANDLGNTTKKTMGDALDAAAKRPDLTLHGALIQGWKNLYGFTSSAGGIRHYAFEGSVEPDLPMAQYFLVTCAAFVNLITALSASN